MRVITLGNLHFENATMINSDISYKEAPIVWDGDVGGRDGDRKTAYKMKIDDAWFWFIGKETFLDNGNDFRIIISFFGAENRLFVECTGDDYRQRFDGKSADLIESRLEQFFLGPEEKNFPPFMLRRAKCIGVLFEPNWIAVH